MLGLMPELIESNGFSVHGVNPPSVVHLTVTMPGLARGAFARPLA